MALQQDHGSDSADDNDNDRLDVEKSIALEQLREAVVLSEPEANPDQEINSYNMKHE